MGILLLSPYPEKLAPAITRTGDTWTATTDPLGDQQADWVISFGYRHIIREPQLSRFAGRMLNVHISLLPWNRGADPNFWSWFDDTPKGVSIHHIDAGIDSGPLVAQQELRMNAADHTLRTSYEMLMRVAVGLFNVTWPAVRDGWDEPIPVRHAGTIHRVKDAVPYWNIMPLKHDTSCQFVAELGAEAHCGKISSTSREARQTPPN
jgi:methionyl-tRNA formyltransferase